MKHPYAKPSACMALVLAFLCATVPAGAEEPAVPKKHEVKFFLKPDAVLDADHTFRKEVREVFQAEGDAAKVQMQFLDNHSLSLNAAGWNVRLRRFEGKGEVEVTYKRRYKVHDTLSETLKKAVADGFHAGETDYEVEVEWGFEHQTLTFSREKSVPPPDGGADLPGGQASRKIAVQEMPDKLNKVEKPGWALNILSDAHVFGPVQGWRWKGKHPKVDDQINLEVWEIRSQDQKGYESVVEVSFKEKNPDKATTKRDELKILLEGKGWLLPRDVLKTQMVLERYGQR